MHARQSPALVPVFWGEVMSGGPWFALGRIFCITRAVVVTGILTVATEMAVAVVIAFIAIASIAMVMVSWFPHVAPPPPTPSPGMGLGRMDTGRRMTLQLGDRMQHGAVQAHGYPPISLPWLHGNVTRTLIPGMVTWTSGYGWRATTILTTSNFSIHWRHSPHGHVRVLCRCCNGLLVVMVVVVMGMVMVVMGMVVMGMVVMDTVVATMVTMVIVALAGGDNDVTMATTVMTMVAVAVGIITVTRFSGVHVRWSAGHVWAPDAGRGETGGTHRILIRGVSHISGHAPIGEVRQVRDLVSPWHLVRASQRVV